MIKPYVCKDEQNTTVSRHKKTTEVTEFNMVINKYSLFREGIQENTNVLSLASEYVRKILYNT